jgi:hypothetical protein
MWFAAASTAQPSGPDSAKTSVESGNPAAILQLFYMFPDSLFEAIVV